MEHEGTLKIGDPDAPRGFYQGDELSTRDLVRQLSLQSYSGGMRVLLLGDVDFAMRAVTVEYVAGARFDDLLEYLKKRKLA